MTFLLAVDPAIAYDRIERRGYDHEEMAYLRAASAAYEALPERPDFVVIDANGTPAEVGAALIGYLTTPPPAVAVPTARVPVGRRGPAAALVSHGRMLLLA
nr:hypothetical protein GCM10020092_093580 [Actinoplanes digitatis]